VVPFTGDFDFLAEAEKAAYKQKEAYRAKHLADIVAFTGVRCQFGGVGAMSDVRSLPSPKRYVFHGGFPLRPQPDDRLTRAPQVVLSLAEPSEMGIVYDELKMQVTDDAQSNDGSSSKTITVSVADCALAAPKSSRPGYANAFRLDTVAPDAGSGLKKFIIALPTEVMPSANPALACAYP
jgi:hypothetical protein